MVGKICKLYEYLFSVVSGYKFYTFNPTKAQLKLITNFIEKRKGVLGDEWLFEFMLFNFFRYHDKKTKIGRGVVQLNWVIGAKAIDSWEKRTEEMVFLMNDFKLKYNIKNPLRDSKLQVLDKKYFDKVRARGDISHCFDLCLYKKDNVRCKLCLNYNICGSLQ